MFEDERGQIITAAELEKEFNDLKQEGGTDCETFEQYIRECTGKNGTLTRI